MAESLYNWCLNKGEYGRILIERWTGIEVDKTTGQDIGGIVDIRDITIGSARKFKFLCNRGHLYIKDPRHLVYKEQYCPYCNISNTSYAEQFIYWSLKQVYPCTENRCKVLKSKENPRGIEFDIGVPDIPLCIEYSPTKWHRDKDTIANMKREVCKHSNVKYLEIIEDSYKEMSESISDNKIIFRMDYTKQDEILMRLVSNIFKIYNIGTIDNIDFDIVKYNALHYNVNSNIEYTKSFEYHYSELSKEWHPSLNILKPSEISKGKSIKVHWQCTKCNYGKNGEWLADTYDRANKFIGCPCCGWHWNTNKFKTNSTSAKAIKGKNDLQTVFPELAKELHPVLNDFTADSVKPRSHRIAYWICNRCGHGKNGEWVTKIIYRARPRGCPYCGYKWYRK